MQTGRRARGLWQYSSPKKSSSGCVLHASPTRNQQCGLAAAAAKHDCRTHPRRKLTRTAWTVALHLYPWGAAQQIPRESRQDARTGVLWGRRAKRRQPSRPPVNRARHLAGSNRRRTAEKRVRRRAKKKTSTNHPRDERTQEPRAGVWTPSDGRVKRTKCKRLLGPRGFLSETYRERIPPRA